PRPRRFPAPSPAKYPARGGDACRKPIAPRSRGLPSREKLARGSSEDHSGSGHTGWLRRRQAGDPARLNLCSEEVPMQVHPGVFVSSTSTEEWQSDPEVGGGAEEHVLVDTGA